MTSPRIFTAQRRPISWIVVTLLCFSLFSSVYLSHANAQASQLEKTGFVEVFEVSGLLDEVLSDVLSKALDDVQVNGCLLYTSPSPRDGLLSRMPSSA